MAFTVVQHKAGTLLTSSAAGLTVATAWPGNTAAGNLLVATVVFKGNATTSSGTASWVKAGTITNGTALQVEVWYKPNSGGTDPSPVFTVANSVQYIVHIAEISGVATATPLDKTGTATGTTTGLAVPTSATITAASEFCYRAGGMNNTSTKASIPWAASTAGGSATLGADIDQLTGAITSVGAEHTWGTSGASGTNPSLVLNESTGLTTAGVIATFTATGAAADPVGKDITPLNNNLGAYANQGVNRSGNF